AKQQPKEMSLSVRTLKVFSNRLLYRKQMIVSVAHGASGKNVSKSDVKTKLAEKFRTTPDLVVCYGFRTSLGGGQSRGYALVYDSPDYMKKFHLVKRVRDASRKQRKERKNKKKRQGNKKEKKRK
ncbi:hypothetical protein BOX15_Mlig001746g1, partial [Macrostomum lignano]